MTARTRSTNNTNISNNIANQTVTGAITPTVEGAQLTDLSDSMFNPLSDTTLALGIVGQATGILNLLGTTSGVITMTPQAAAGTYNLNLPTTAGTAGQVLTSGGGGTAPMTWSTPSSGGSYTPPVTTKGDLFGYDTAPNRLPVGTNGQVLTVDSTTALGIKWAAASGGAYTPPVTTKGDIFTYDTAPQRLPVGTDGQMLIASSAAATGLAWAAAVKPAGSTGNIQYNNAGAFAASSANVDATGNFTAVGNITAAAGMTITATSGNNLILTGGNTVQIQRLGQTCIQLSNPGTLTCTIPAVAAFVVAGVSTHSGFTTHASGFSAPTRAITANATTAITDYAVFASGTGVTVTLHTPTTGQLLNIKNTNASGGAAITLSGTNDFGTSIAAGVNVSFIYDTAGATWRAQ